MRVLESIMQAVGTTLPKLYCLSGHTVTAPERGEWYLAIAELVL